MVFAPITVISALLYYFGFIRERAFWAHFGVDLGTVGFSSTDYILRSPGTFFAPLAGLVGLALVALLVHQGFVLWITNPRRSRRWAVVTVSSLAITACGFLIIGLLSVAFGSLQLPVLGPVLLGVGAGLLEYAIVTARMTQVTRPGLTDLLFKQAAVYSRRTLIIALVVGAMFAAIADLANQQGTRAATAISGTLPIQPKVIVYSRLLLQLSGTGVAMVPLEPTNTAYAYRYNGLRLLLHNGDRWIIVPAGWTPKSGDTVIILKDSEDVRVDLAPSG